jgi:SAM-dependent methyltransferase
MFGVSDWLSILVLIIALLGLSWIFIPIFSGIPWVPSSDRRIGKALEMSGLKPGERFYDLGCGDGRVLIAAAGRFGARAVGIEISPLHCLVARVRLLAAGIGSSASVRWGNFNSADLSDADVVYQFGHSRYAQSLKQHLEQQLREGTRVVSINVDIPGWQPEAVDRENLVFLYRMPPARGDVASYFMQEGGAVACGSIRDPGDHLPGLMMTRSPSCTQA